LKIHVSCDDAASHGKSIRLEEVESAENIEKLTSPFDRLPPKAVLRVMSFLTMQERWRMRLSRRLKDIEESERLHIPMLRVVSCDQAVSDGCTIRVPPDPSHWAQAHGQVIEPEKAGNVIAILKKLSQYSIGTMHLHLPCSSWLVFRDDVLK
ncbi:hypothetical protein PMAYCL1PPCAC_25695, partial [Pristionchus mayeri]